jgi:ABC-type multidrug transport system fused ATPase/permease subunit
MAYSDLSGIFYIQQQYLADLSALTLYGAGPTAVNYMKELGNNLSNVYNTYQNANPNAVSILTGQNDMKTIIENENTRINTKKDSVDSALFGQKRMAHFSDSYSKKYLAQMKILFVVIIVILIYLGLTYLDNLINVPDSIFTFIMVVVGIFAVLIILITMRDIRRRYNMDFDKLNLTSPVSSKTGGEITGNVDSGSLNLCVGESCCPEGNAQGSVWDSSKARCWAKSLLNIKSGFTVMSDSNNQVKAYEPSEIGSYMLIK